MTATTSLIDDSGTDEPLAVRDTLPIARRSRAANRLTIGLLVAFGLSVGFLVGVLIQKDQGATSSSSSTPDFSALAQQFGGALPGGGAEQEQAPQARRGGGTTTGQIKLVDGANVYVADAQGHHHQGGDELRLEDLDQSAQFARRAEGWRHRDGGRSHGIRWHRHCHFDHRRRSFDSRRDTVEGVTQCCASLSECAASRLVRERERHRQPGVRRRHTDATVPTGNPLASYQKCMKTKGVKVELPTLPARGREWRAADGSCPRPAVRPRPAVAVAYRAVQAEGRIHQEVELRTEGVLEQAAYVRRWWAERRERPRLPGIPQLPVGPWREAAIRRWHREHRPQ